MSVIIMILLLSVLILVHEAGHFLAARFFKIKVEKFGFGLPIGPTLYETQWGETKILIHAFLLGGYIAFPDDEKDCELEKSSPERFLNRPIYQRAIVVSAGVFANIVCAFVFVFLTAALWGHMPSGKYDIYVNDIVAQKSENIWQSGMKKHDKIENINGSKIDSTYSLINFIQLSKAYDGKIDASAPNNILTQLKQQQPALEENEIIPNEVAVALPKTQLEEPIRLDYKELKGMKKYADKEISLSSKQIKLRNELIGKKIYVSDGQYSLKDIAYALSDNSRPVFIEVLRDGQLIKLKPITANKKGLIGIKLEAKEILITTKTPKQVIVTGTKYLSDNTYMMLYGLYQIVTGKVPLKDLHGIVAITKVGGDIIDNSGFFSGLLLIAVISMDLAIVNFLPIPALDGGHMMFLLIEKLRGKPLDEQVIDKIGNIGFMFLIALMVFVVFNDVFGLITKKF